VQFTCGVQHISRRLVRYVHVEFMRGGMYVRSSCVHVCMCRVHAWSATYFM